jgi:hypothetical protein
MGSPQGGAMKKPKHPKLVVDNKLPDESSEELTFEEFKMIANKIMDVRKHYPKIDALSMRAHKNKDLAMSMALMSLEYQYDYWRDVITERKREKLRVVKRKRD